jgi:hypothetical protein
MFHFAANYIFDGENFIKNSLITTNSEGLILSVGNENDAVVERPRMIFYNGIILPQIINIYNKNSDVNQIFELDYQLQALMEMKNFFRTNPEIELKDILKLFTKTEAVNRKWEQMGQLRINTKPGLVLLENIDLINLLLTEGATIKIVI